jgi:hypothetical protein
VCFRGAIRTPGKWGGRGLESRAALRTLPCQGTTGTPSLVSPGVPGRTCEFEDRAAGSWRTRFIRAVRDRVFHSNVRRRRSRRRWRSSSLNPEGESYTGASVASPLLRRRSRREGCVHGGASVRQDSRCDNTEIQWLGRGAGEQLRLSVFPSPLRLCRHLFFPRP